MKLEEAKANIGKEVVLDESTKPYKNGTLILEIKSNDFINGILLDVDHYSTAKVDTIDGFHLFINIEHLKLKEQPMQNYKIKVTPENSDSNFRLKPQTIHIDGGDYTKEELLKIAGEME